MSVAIGVVAHKQRRSYASQLADTVNAAVLSLDDGTLGCNANHAAVYERLAAIDAPWCCVLEDDVVPTISFTGQLHKIMAAAPSPIVALYLGRSRPVQFQARISDAIDKAHANGACFITAERLFSAQGVLMRTELVADMLAMLNRRRPIDEAISAWARRRRLPIAYTVPSIVEHRDLPTLFRHPDGQPRLPGRVAWSVGTRTQWSPEVVKL